MHTPPCHAGKSRPTNSPLIPVALETCQRAHPNRNFSQKLSLPLPRWLASLALLTAATTALQAGSDTWSGLGGDNNWGTAGNWAAGSANQPPVSGDSLIFSGSTQPTANNNLATFSFGGLTFSPAAGAFTLTGNSLTLTGPLLDNSTSLETVNLPVTLTTSQNITVAGGGSLLVGGVISGAGGITNNGLGSLTLTNANLYTGTTTLGGGNLTLDFFDGGLANNLISPSSVLVLAGGNLNVNGGNVTASSQSFASTTLFTAGGGGINAASATPGATLPTLNLGALTYDVGASLVLNGPATSTGVTTTSGQNGANGNGTSTGAVAATANLTTTTGAANTVMVSPVGGPQGYAAYSTVGLYDFAGYGGSSPYTITGLSQLSGGTAGDGLYTLQNTGNVANNAGVFYDIFGACAEHNSTSVGGLRFNAPGAGFTASSSAFCTGGILVTPNMGANNTVIGGSVGVTPGMRNATAGNGGTVVIWQNNILGNLNFTCALGDGKVAGGVFVYAGPGTVNCTGANTYTGQTYLNNGVTEIQADSGLGAPATAAAANLNGGTILGNANFTLDNGGANLRPINLGVNGGGLAATAGNTMTVDGLVGSGPSGGRLIIGIPASATNGNVVGLVPGTGTGTANTTPVYATGKVILNNTAGNYFYGGVSVVGGATLNINGNYALGGANYLGGLSINNSTLQYNATLNSSGDISQSSGGIPQAVTLIGAVTIDINGHSITYANPIGNGGNGALTVVNSGSAGVGGLLLNGGVTYTGGTTVASGAALGGTGTIAGNVTWAAGSYAILSQAAPLTVSGTVTLNNTTVQLTASGLTTGVYTLLTATGGFAGGSTVNSTAVGTGAIANGYGGSVSISGNKVILTVVQLGVAATWTDALGDQNWSEAGNWTGGFAPQNPGDAATFGTGGVGAPVNLNQNETVGALAFTNASSYTIAGTSTLTLDNKGNGVGILVTAGTANAINAPLALNGNVTATVSTGDSLALGGAVANKASPETLTVTGGGTTVLNAANSYGPAAGSVGTTLAGATVQVGNNNSLGAGDVSVTANSALQAGATGLNLANNVAVSTSHTVALSGNNLTLSGVISGNGVLAASGGNVTLANANNTYAGGTTLNGGILAISTDGAAAGNAGNLGVVPAAPIANNLILSGGDLLATATLTVNTNRGIGIGSAAPSSTAVTTALLDAASGQTLTIGGVIASAGNLGTNNLTVNSEPGSTGTVVLGGADTFNGTNIVAGGEEQLADSQALQNSTVYYNHQGGVLDFGSLTAVTLGGLIGTQNLSLTDDSDAAVALTIGNNTVPALYTGILSDGGTGGSLTINGPGSQQIGSGSLGGATYTGNTTLNYGTLILGGNTSLTGVLNLTGLNGACNATIQDSAVIANSGTLYLASAGGAAYPGACTLTLLGNANVSAPAFSFGDTSRVPSCTLTIAGNAALNLSGGFELNLSEGSTTENNVVNLNGGTLTTSDFTLTDGSTATPTHEATINLNGGVLAASSDDPSGGYFLGALNGLTVNVLSNGVTVNPNSYDITIAAALAGAGGLTNIGTGTLNLAGANTYLGATFITNGATLSVVNTSGSATGTNTVTVGTGGTLEGTGAIAGNVMVNSGGTLSGSEVISGSVTLLPGALANFSLGNSAAPLTAGVLTLNNNIITLNVPGTALGVGSYTLINYTAAGSTGVFNPIPVFTGSGLVSGVQATITTSGGAVNLVVSPNVVSDVWVVDANGNWTTAANWSSNPTVPGNPGDAALLGIGTAERTVTLNANESLGYLTLSNANSFVIANGGHVLTLDNSGNGAFVTVSGGTSNLIQTAVALNDNATFTVFPGDVLAVSSALANSSAGNPKTLTLSGSGELNLVNADSYGPASGSTGTILNGGILQVGNNKSLGAGDVSVAGNGTLQDGAAGLNLTNNVNVASGATLTVNDNGNAFGLGGVINGAGSIIKLGAGSVTLTNNNGLGGALLVNQGTLVLGGSESSGSASITNSAIVELVSPGSVGGSLLGMNSGSTLELRSDTSATFTPASLAPANAAVTLNIDVNPLTSATGQQLTLSGALNFPASQLNQTINITGGHGYSLYLQGGISAISATTHNPFQMVDINVIPGMSAQIDSFTTGNWGDFLNFSGGGNLTMTGNFSNTSNGSGILTVNNGTTVTLLGQTVKVNTGDAYSYYVQNGTLVSDNSLALINNTSGTANNLSLFIVGPATNIVTAGTTALPTGFTTINVNNSVNCAFYLGDVNNLTGGLTTPANLTNNISDGDIGFTNSGIMTIGGQNTSGINTYANNLILGWTANRGKSVTLVAASGGEVDFTGSIVHNGTDKTAGITVGSAGFGGLVKLAGTNTYFGPTIVNDGTLALANLNGYDAYIGDSSLISIRSGAILDVTGQGSSTLPVGTGTVAQTVAGSGTVNGILTVGSQGTLAPGSATTTGNLTVNTSATLGGGALFKLNNTSSPTSDELSSPVITAGGTLTVTNIGPALAQGSTFRLFSSAVSGFSSVTLPVSDNNYRYTWNNQLGVNGTITVQSATLLVNTNPAPITSSYNGSTLTLSWPADHIGWRLQVQTNALSSGLGATWVTVPGSTTVNTMSFPVVQGNPTVFYRQVYP